MMKDKQVNNYPNIKLIAILSFGISVLIHTAMFLSFYFSDGIIYRQMVDSHRPPFHMDGFILNIAYTFIITMSLYFYCMYMQRKNVGDGKKLLYTILGLIVGTVVLSFVFSTLHPLTLKLLNKDIPPFRMDIRLYSHALMRDSVVAIIVAFSWELIVMNGKRQKIMLENERLIAENLITRYEVLKNQINPHFLFNSLNTLQSLIRMDQTKAEIYVQELSKVLRYSMQNDEIVTVEEEVQLASSFCTLMQIRYGKNLIFNFDIDERMKHDEIIPLSLQILIENAIKHNVISDKQPLAINVSSDFANRKIIVENRIQPKMDRSAVNGIGLANLSERYRLKWNNDIDIFNDNVTFCVVLNLNNVK